MENLTQGHMNVDEIVAILPDASDAMAGAERWLMCRDQAEMLTEAVEDVLKRADREFTQAYLDHRIRSESALRRETMGMVFDVATLLLGGRGQERSKRDIKTIKLPKVVIAVGPEGIPDDIRVVNVSEVAKQEGKVDGMVERDLVSDGYVLLGVEGFKELTSWLQLEVMSGLVCLPYHPTTVGAKRPLTLFSKPRFQLPSQNSLESSIS